MDSNAGSKHSPMPFCTPYESGKINFTDSLYVKCYNCFKFVNVYSICFCREVRLTSVQKEVERHTRNSSRTKHSEEMVQKAATQSGGVASGMQIKDLHIEIPSAKIMEAHKAMKLQTAHRGRVQAGPTNNGKTLHELKNVQPEPVEKNSNQNASNIEDCHVTTNDSSYGDWLIEQGLILPVKICKNGDNGIEDPKDKEVNVEPTKTKVEQTQLTGDDICKILDSVVPPTPSDSLNDLIDKLNKYIGPQTVPDCETKIKKLKEILTILDTDGKAKEMPSENMQKDVEIKKPQTLVKKRTLIKNKKKKKTNKRITLNIM